MRFFRSPKFSAMVPWLLLATAIIIIYRVIAELPFVFSMISWFLSIITPFFYGFILAYVLNIPCSGINKLYGKVKNEKIRKRRRGLSIITIYFLFLIFLFFVLRLVIPQVFSSIEFFLANLPSYYEAALGLLAYVDRYVDFDIQAYVLAELSLENVLGFVQRLEFDATLFLANVGTFLFRIVLALISSIYILVEKDKFRAYLTRAIGALTPRSVHEPLFQRTAQLNRNFKRYLFNQAIIAMILGLMSLVILLILRSPYAFVLALMMGLFNFIPYFGSIVATGVSAVVVFLTQGPTMGLIALLALIGAQQIDANVVQPKVHGGSFSLSPLLIIMAITIGAASAGILGMVMAIPIVALLKDLFDTFIAYKEKRKEESPLEEE